MTTAFRTILNMSFSAGWLILALIVMRPLLRKLPKSGIVLLWGLVALRLLVPFSVESRFSLIPDTMPSVELPLTENLESGISSPPPTINIDIVADAATGSLDLLSVFSILWCVGVLFLAAYFIFGYCRLTHRLNTAVLLRDNVYQCEGIGAPIVFGIIHPKICIPFRVDESNMNHIIAHEKSHIRRGDHWWKLIGYFVLMLHWFNPLVWISYILLGRDIEIACDEAVIRDLDNNGRADYAQALVTYSTKRQTLAVPPLAFGETAVKSRLKSIMNYRRVSRWSVAFIIVSCMFLAMCFLTDPVQAVETDMPPKIETEETIPPTTSTLDSTDTVPVINNKKIVDLERARQDLANFQSEIEEIKAHIEEQVRQNVPNH